MMPLTDALKMACNSVVLTRVMDFRDDLDLTVYEIGQIHRFLEDNCPMFTLSIPEIRLLFRSYQKKRIHPKKKKTNSSKQLSLYA